MAKKDQRKLYVVIRSDAVRKPEKLEAWRYWEIVGELTWRSADRLEAYDAAKWCGLTAKAGDRRTLYPGITLEVVGE